MSKRKTPITETQSTRRVKYGLNVFIAVVAAIAIVVLINWISYRSFRSGATRIDLTSTRQYSLSPLTHKVLDALKGEIRLVTLMDASSDEFEDTQRARDLIDEYDRASDSVTVQHINPGIETGKLDDFRKSIHDRFAHRLEKLEGSIDAATALITKAIDELDSHIAALKKITEHPNLQPNRDMLLLRDLKNFLERTRNRMAKALKKEQQYDDDALPTYSQTLIHLIAELDVLDRQIYPALIKNNMDPLKDSPTVPGKVLDDVLKMRDAMTFSQAARLEIVREMKKIDGVPAYDEIVSQLALPNPVVIMAEKKIVVLPIDELFRTPVNAPDDPDSKGLANKQFLGEERITGILARMTYAALENPPMIVFCRVGTGLATSPKRDYTQLMERLANMDLAVTVWDPTSKPAAMGPNAPPPPPPVIAEGQKAVWVVMPGDPVDPNNPLSTTVQSFVVSHVRKRMDLGDGALIMSRPESDTKALDHILHEWGVTIDFNRLVLRNIVDRVGQERPTSEHVVRQWPTEHPVTKAIGEQGMTGRFSWSSPIRVNDKTTGVTYWPLIEMKGSELWANFRTSELKSQKTEIKRGLPENITADTFVTAYAAERAATKDMPRARLMAVGDNFWGMDTFGSYTQQDPVTRRLTTITPFPANHELFINGVLWLADMDEMIAASSRSQDIARIAAISVGGMQALKVVLLLGMPAGVLVIGLFVWWTRRG